MNRRLCGDSSEMKHVIIVLSVIAILLMGVSTHAFMVATKEVSLPKSESSRLENIVCISRHKISSATVTAYQYSEDQIPLAFNFAYVQCKPHGEFKGLPTYFTARCDYINQKWNCDESEAHTLVIINNRKVDVVPGITKPELADDILKKIITYGSFRGRSIDK